MIDVLNVLIGALNAILAIVLLVYARRLRVGGAPVLWALAAMFVLRAITRAIPPFGAHTPVGLALVDGLTLIVLVMVLFGMRSLVSAFRSQQDAVQRAQLDYDLALHSLERSIVDDLDAQMAEIETLLAGAARAGEATQLRDAQENVAQLRMRLRAAGAIGNEPAT